MGLALAGSTLSPLVHRELSVKYTYIPLHFIEMIFPLVYIQTDQKENRQYDKKMEEILSHNIQWITFLTNNESLLVSEDSSNSAITSLNVSHTLYYAKACSLTVSSPLYQEKGRERFQDQSILSQLVGTKYKAK